MKIVASRWTRECAAYASRGGRTVKRGADGVSVDGRILAYGRQRQTDVENANVGVNAPSNRKNDRSIISRIPIMPNTDYSDDGIFFFSFTRRDATRRDAQRESDAAADVLSPSAHRTKKASIAVTAPILYTSAFRLSNGHSTANVVVGPYVVWNIWPTLTN